jgi:AAA15 family ATPase/GTPase
MIESIHIQNFRCFEDLKLEGFGRVNLIGGVNNSGKTVLLEGLLLGGGHQPKAIVVLKKTRHSNVDILKKEAKSIIWDEFFFNRDKKQIIDIKTVFSDGLMSKTTYEIQSDIFLSEESLAISYFHNKNKYLEIAIEVDDEGKEEFKNKKYDASLHIKNQDSVISFVTTKDMNKSHQQLVNNYSKFVLSGEANYVLEGFQAIDDSIEDIEIVSLNEPNLYLKRKDELLMPMALFGDAIGKIAEIITKMIVCKNGILLIDEIENGIHYTNQPKVWELIFKLAKKFNVQVFATTHSKEMTEAFNKIAKERGYERDAKYLEMARHYKTKRIIGTFMEMDILTHKLNHNQAFRGE